MGEALGFKVFKGNGWFVFSVTGIVEADGTVVETEESKDLKEVPNPVHRFVVVFLIIGFSSPLFTLSFSSLKAIEVETLRGCKAAVVEDVITWEDGVDENCLDKFPELEFVFCPLHRLDEDVELL